MHSTCTVATSALLFALGCGATPLGPGSSNRAGNPSTGGNFATGGVSYSGPGLGGTQSSSAGTGGVTPSGGIVATGGSSAITCTTPVQVSSKNCGVPSTVVGNFGIDWYHDYASLDHFAGFAYVFIAPTPNPSDTFVCYSSFWHSTVDLDTGADALCGAGTVPADCTRNAVAGIGFNLNQPQWGYGTFDNGYTQPTNPIESPATVSSVTVAFVNTADSDLRIQIAQHSVSGSIYYCWDIAGMQSPLTVSASHFTTTCWDSANPGATWDGTGAESIAFIIPSQAAKPTPFDACMQNVEFH